MKRFLSLILCLFIGLGMSFGQDTTLVFGKAYTFSFKSKNSDTQYYLTDNSSTVSSTTEKTVWVIGSTGNKSYPYFAVSNNQDQWHYLSQGNPIIYDTTCQFRIINKLTQNGSGNQAKLYFEFNTTTNPHIGKTNSGQDWQNIKWGTDIPSDDIIITEVTYPYTTINMTIDDINEEGIRPGYSFGEYFASIYLPFPFVMSDGIEAYKGVKDNGDFIKMERVEGSDIPKGAYILYKTSDDATKHLILPSTANPTTDVSNNMLIGSTKNPGVNEDAVFNGIPYVLAKHTTGGYKQVGFYKYTGTIYPKGKAIYVKNESVSGPTSTKAAKLFDFSIVEDIQTLVTVIPTDNVYDLTGRKVKELGRGINIYNGKKIIK